MDSKGEWRGEGGWLMRELQVEEARGYESGRRAEWRLAGWLGWAGVVAGGARRRGLRVGKHNGGAGWETEERRGRRGKGWEAVRERGGGWTCEWVVCV